jgi:hypothetical protein
MISHDGPERLIIETALRHLQLYCSIDGQTPVLGVTFYPTDSMTPYDWWFVLFETHPGCDPP